MSPLVHPSPRSTRAGRGDHPADAPGPAADRRWRNGLAPGASQTKRRSGMARDVRLKSGMRRALHSTFRFPAVGLLLLCAWFCAGGALAAPADLEAELRRTDATIDQAYRVAGRRPPAAVASLLTGARERQAEARGQWSLGRPGRALLDTRVARRLAERAIEALNPASDGRDQLERQLRRGDRRLAAARAWLTVRATRPRLLRQLALAEGEMAAAWRNYRAGRAHDALLRLSTVRQFIRDLESRGFAAEVETPPGGAADERRRGGGAGEQDAARGGAAVPHLEATERWLAACAAATGPERPPVALGVARAAQSEAWLLAHEGRAREAGLATVELRRALVDTWGSDLPRTQAMSAALADANDLVLERWGARKDKDAAGSGRGIDRESLRGWRTRQREAREALAAHRPVDAWHVAAGVARELATFLRSER